MQRITFGGIVAAAVAFLAILGLGIGLGFALDSDETKIVTASPAPAASLPHNMLSATLSDDGQLTLPQQEFVTDGTPLKLRLAIQNNGGNPFTGSPVLGKSITVVSTGRTDHTSNMVLPPIVMQRNGTNGYLGFKDFVLPLGTYGFQYDGRPIAGTSLVVKAATKAATPR